MIFCLNRIDHQKWWIFAKKVGQNFHYFVSYSAWSFLLFSIVILLCHSHSWKIKEGIVYFKNEYNFWIPCAKYARNVKVCRSNSIISKIMRPSFLQFSVLKGTPVRNLSSVTSLLSKIENSNLNNSRNNGNFDLLFFANIYHFWWSIWFQQKMWDNSWQWTSPLNLCSI